MSGTVTNTGRAERRRLLPNPARGFGVKAIQSWFHRHRLIVVFGAGTEIIYLLYFVRQFPLWRYYQVDTDMGFITGHSPDRLVLFTLIIGCLFTLFALAGVYVPRRPDPSTLPTVLGFGSIFALTMCFVYPITAIDIFTYVAQSRILVHYGQNPIFAVPALYPHDAAMALTGGWVGFGAPYGPLGILIDALPTALVGNNLFLNLLLLKLMFSAAVLGSAFLVYCQLRRKSASRAVQGALLVCWNPLIVIEIGANGHNDAAMMLFALAGLLLLQRNRLTLGAVMVVVSALVKYATGLLFPLALVYGLTRHRDRQSRIRYTFLTCGCASLAIAAAYLPFWRGIETLDRGLLENSFYIASFSSVLSDLLSPHLSPDGASLIGRLLFIPLYVYALVRSARSFHSLLLGCFLALFAFLALAVNDFKGWYAVWTLMLVACLPSRPIRLAGLLLGCAVSLSPALFMYGAPWLSSRVPDPTSVINGFVYLLDFLPAAFVLVVTFGRSSVSRGIPDPAGETASPVSASGE